MKLPESPELAELCQALLEILRAAVAANQDQEVQSTPLKSTEQQEPGPEGTP